LFARGIPKQPPLLLTKRPLFMLPFEQTREQAVEYFSADLSLTQSICSLLNREQVLRVKKFPGAGTSQFFLTLSNLIDAV
jgi:hypothetical protein